MKPSEKFPAALQPIIDQGFLNSEFNTALRARLGYGAVAETVKISGELGDPQTHTRGAETYTITPDLYQSPDPATMTTNRVGIVSQFLQNAYLTGEQAGRALDELARAALLSAYDHPNAVRLGVDRALTMGDLLNAITKLRLAATPEIDGAYNCYLDPVSARQLFADPDFRQLFQGATSSNQVFRRGMVNDFLGVRFVPVQDVRTTHHIDPERIRRRAIVCGAGALVRGHWDQAMTHAPDGSVTEIINGVGMVAQYGAGRVDTIQQSWFWIGGFAAPVNAATGIGSRAVVIEHAGDRT